MNENLGEKISHYYDTLEREKRPRMERMKEVSEFLAPHRAGSTEITDKPNEEHLGEDIYDGNPIDAVRKMTDGIFGNSVGPTSTWMEQEVVDNERRYANERLDRWMRKSDKQMYKTMGASGFYRSIYQAIRDGVSLGNAAMLTRPNGRLISYKTVSPFHYFFEEDENNNLIIFMYRFPMTALKAWKMFGEKVPQVVKDDLEAENFTQNRWYLYTIMENDTASRMQGAKPSSQKPFVSVIKLLQEGDEIISRGGFNENPVALWQYYRESGEKWGRGPGDEAYYDVQYVNRLSQSVLEGALLRAAPPMQAPMEMKAQSDFKYRPKSTMYYSSPERQVAFMNPGGEYMTPIDLLQRKDQIIDYHFMVDFWTMLSRSTKRMTAYEASEVQGEKLALLSYVIQNFFGDFVTPILERSYSIAMDNEIIQRPEANWVRGVETEFKFNGLLAQAQRRAVEGAGMMRAFQEVAPILEVNPNAGIVVDWEQFIRRRFEINNVEATIINTEDEVDKIKEAAMRQQQAAQQNQAVTEAAKASEKPQFEQVLSQMGG